MRVRPATQSEIPAVARIGTLAFAQDPSYGHFYPWREQYPKDFYRRLLHNYKKLMVTPGDLVMVVELDKTEDEAGKIVGYITMRRSGGTKEEHDKWSADSTSKKLRRLTLNLSGACSSIFRPNRAVNQAALDNFWGQAFAVHATTPYTGKLDVLTLAVLPEYQRHGVGEKLLEYSAYRAYEEGIPVFGDATEKGLPLYIKNGCKIIGNVNMPQTTYTKNGGKLPVPIDKLDTPVVRWDAANVTGARLEKASAVV